VRKQENDICKECNGKLIITQNEVYCKDCGLVVDDIIDTGKSSNDPEATIAPINSALTPFPIGTTYFNPKEKNKNVRKR